MKWIVFYIKKKKKNVRQQRNWSKHISLISINFRLLRQSPNLQCFSLNEKLSFSGRKENVNSDLISTTTLPTHSPKNPFKNPYITYSILQK